MDELNTSLLNYRKAFKAKLDAYASPPIEIPIIEDRPTPSAPVLFDTDVDAEPSPQNTSPKQPSEAPKPKPKPKPKGNTAITPNPPIFTPPIIDNSPRRPLPTPPRKKHITRKILTSFGFRFSLGILLLLLL